MKLTDQKQGIYVHVCIYICVRVYAYMHTHTHIYTQLGGIGSPVNIFKVACFFTANQRFFALLFTGKILPIFRGKSGREWEMLAEFSSTSELFLPARVGELCHECLPSSLFPLLDTD